MSNDAEHEAKSFRTTDPALMRALAHPLRVEMLAILDAEGERTASQLAERLGQNVANASFHLRTLEKSGYVERGEQRGREKPWRSVHHSRNHTPDPADPESIREASSLAALYVQRESARLLSTLERAGFDATNPEWVLATTVTNGDFWATSEEMKDVVAQLGRILEPFAGRSQDPSKRPVGSRRGHLFATVNPDPDCEPWKPDAASGSETTPADR